MTSLTENSKNTINIVLIDKYFNLEKTLQNIEFSTINNHSKLCLDAAQLSAPYATYFLINAADKCGIISEPNVIIALEQCFKFKPSIIIMPFSFESVSNKFKKVIKRLQAAGVIVCASVDSIVKNSFPASLENVIAVDEMIANPAEDESDIQFIDEVFFVNPVLYEKKTLEKGSSFASAFLAGYIAKLLQFNPFLTAKTLKDFFIKKIKTTNFTRTYNSFCANFENIYFNDFSDLILNNYKYYYNREENAFKKILDDMVISDSFVTGVDIIDSNDFNVKQPVSLFDEFKRKRIPFKFYGNTQNTSKSLDNYIDSIKDDYLKYISVPSIYIMSYSTNMEKLSIQLYLNKFFKKDNFNLGNISFNSLSKIFGFQFVSFPRTVLYPEYFYYINELFHTESKGKDLLLASIPGKIDRFVDFNHRLGDLSHIFFTINSPDIVIISLSSYIEAKELLMIRDYIKDKIGSKIIFYVSQNSKDDNFYGTSDYNLILDEKSVSVYCKEIQLITREKAFSRSSLSDDAFYKFIKKLFK